MVKVKSRFPWWLVSLPGGLVRVSLCNTSYKAHSPISSAQLVCGCVCDGCAAEEWLQSRGRDSKDAMTASYAQVE